MPYSILEILLEERLVVNWIPIVYEFNETIIIKTW